MAKKKQEVGKMVSFEADKGAKKKNQKKKKQAERGEAATATASTASGPPASSPRPSADQVKAMTKEAITVIKKGIAKPGSQDKVCFIPDDWNSKFKPILGKYRKFVLKCGEFKVVAQGVGSTQVKIVLKSDDTVEAEKLLMQWQTKVRQAWQEYLVDVPKEDRNPAAFLAAARRTCGFEVAGSQAESQPEEEPLPAKKGGNNNNSKTKKRKEAGQAAGGDLDDEVFGGDDVDDEGGSSKNSKKAAKGNKYAHLKKAKRA
mmetsp:Transcript_66585/g.139015  ORF Transcript_66585/g.139015 Transcript_66585/m.139015 type:complete len:259 (-) Transcript_66585:49-825(-)